MKNDTLGGCSSINAYVAAKLKRFSESKKDFATLFELMFSEAGNVMFERSAGYRIETLTYGEVRERILRRASKLRERLSSAGEGAIIGLLHQNGSDWIELFWAILVCGCSPLLMNTRLGHEPLDGALTSIGAKAVISDDGRGFSVPVIDAGELLPGEASLTPAAFGESLFVMSSGTSDHVKVCEYGAEEFGCMIADSVDIITKCPAMKRFYHGSLKQLSFLPFCHIFGLVAVYIWFAFFARTFVVLKDMAPRTIIDTIRRHEVTHIFAVPMFWNKVHDEALKAIRERGEKTYNKFMKGMHIAKKLSGVPLIGSAFRRFAFREVREGLFGKSISFLISGGSEISSEVLEFFNCIGYRLANGYGMTETGITSVELSSDMSLLCGGSVGLPFSSCSYSVDEKSQLIISGPSRAKRIYEGGKVHERGDSFETGDIAEFRSGRWYVLGRMDDLVISPTGENLNPCLIEDKLFVPGMRECCLTSVREDGRICPVLVASIKPLLDNDGVKRLFETVKSRISQSGLEGQICRVILVREPLIGEDDYKLNRRKIAERLRSGAFTPVDPDSSAENGGPDAELILKIRGMFAKALGKDIDSIGAGTDFFLDEGGSSLDFFGVVAQLQDEYGVTFPADSGRSLSRPYEIARFIVESANDN